MRTAQRAIRLLSKLTRRLIKQKARHHCRGSSDTLLAYGFRYCFTPLTAVLFTFPSRYLFTIGHWLVFSLTPWSALDSCEISRVSHYSGYPPCGLQCRLRAFHLLWSIIPHASPISVHNYAGPTTPLKNQRFRLFRIRSPLLTESLSFSVP